MSRPPEAYRPTAGATANPVATCLDVDQKLSQKHVRRLCSSVWCARQLRCIKAPICDLWTMCRTSPKEASPAESDELDPDVAEEKRQMQVKVPSDRAELLSCDVKEKLSIQRVARAVSRLCSSSPRAVVTGCNVTQALLKQRTKGPEEGGDDHEALLGGNGHAVEIYGLQKMFRRHVKWCALTLYPAETLLSHAHGQECVNLRTFVDPSIRFGYASQSCRR